MQHDLQVLAKSTQYPPYESLRQDAEGNGFVLETRAEEEEHYRRLGIGAHLALKLSGRSHLAKDYWQQLFVMSMDGRELAAVDRLPVQPGTPGARELQAACDEVEGWRPQSAAPWLKTLLREVSVVYGIRVLAPAEEYLPDTVGRIASDIQYYAKGIERHPWAYFNNENYLVLCRPDFSRSGRIHVAVRSADDEWLSFDMDAGDPRQREAFLDGRVPDGATPKPVRR